MLYWRQSRWGKRVPGIRGVQCISVKVVRRIRYYLSGCNDPLLKGYTPGRLANVHLHRPEQAWQSRPGDYRTRYDHWISNLEV